MLVHQAAVLDCLSFDGFSPFQDGGSASEIDVGRCQIADVFVVASVIVVINEGADAPLEIAGQAVALEQDAVLHRLMPALDLALGHRVFRRAAHMRDPPIAQPCRQIARDVVGAIIRQQSRPLAPTVAPGGRQRQLDRRRHVGGFHRRAEFPRDDEARVVVQDGRQIEPAPADHLQIREVGLPELVRVGRGSISYTSA